MADYWKSTPKYWCKHCQVYVPDTKIQRANHDATGKHQSAVRRALRNLHRDHERQEREKDEAKREVARLNALVDGKAAPGAAGPASSSSSSRPPRPPSQTAPPANASRQQLEQLAELGVSIPDEFRPDLALAGDWTVTETRVIEVQEGDGNATKGAATRSFGVRKRPRETGEDGDDDDDDEKKAGHSEFEKVDHDAAVQGLFKRPRQWGRDSRTAGGSGGLDDDIGDLDSLLSSAVAKPKNAKEETEDAKEETKDEVKKEGGADSAAASISPPTKIKKEVDTEALGSGLAEADGETAAEPAVLFKKRKAKPGRK